MACSNKSKKCATTKNTTATKKATVAKKPITAQKATAAKKTIAAVKPVTKVAKKPSSPSSEFTFFDPEAKEVFVVGEFDNWDTGKNKMRRFKDGTWKKKIKLDPGQYEYRFLVDGDWQNDPQCKEHRPNSFGSENSVLKVV